MSLSKTIQQSIIAGTILTLIEVARKTTWYDNLEEGEYLVIDDYAGGNVDDAFYGGERAGEIQLARDTLAQLGIEWEE